MRQCYLQQRRCWSWLSRAPALPLPPSRNLSTARGCVFSRGFRSKASTERYEASTRLLAWLSRAPAVPLPPSRKHEAARGCVFGAGPPRSLELRAGRLQKFAVPCPVPLTLRCLALAAPCPACCGRKPASFPPSRHRSTTRAGVESQAWAPALTVPPSRHRSTTRECVESQASLKP